MGNCEQMQQINNQKTLSRGVQMFVGILKSGSTSLRYYENH